MPDQQTLAINKVVYGNDVLMDLTSDTVEEQYLMQGYTAHKSDGSAISGTAIRVYPIEVVRLI